jgi:hypothetical protein
MKPLYRWTIGDVSPAGLEVFEEAVRMTQRTLGRRFDWAVCSNAHSAHVREAVARISERYGLYVHESRWEELPLPPDIIPVVNDINAPPGVPHGSRQGSFWKMCPPRLRTDAHEIIADNDVILTRVPPQLDTFLGGHVTLLLQEDAHSPGKYGPLLGENETFNSGLMGLPPGYDFAERIMHHWRGTGSFRPLLSRDEQGLLTYTLKQEPHVIISKDQIAHLYEHGRAGAVEFAWVPEAGGTAKFVSRLSLLPPPHFRNSYCGYHFLNVNRSDRHPAWEEYKWHHRLL